LTFTDLSCLALPAADAAPAGCGIFWLRFGVVGLRNPPDLGADGRLDNVQSNNAHYALDHTALQS
jgi:hypothetical protein